ncbi:MAG: hypothetical protein QXM43_02865 [Desulfurococcaceae archaeon]
MARKRKVARSRFLIHITEVNDAPKIKKKSSDTEEKLSEFIGKNELGQPCIKRIPTKEMIEHDGDYFTVKRNIARYCTEALVAVYPNVNQTFKLIIRSILKERGVDVDSIVPNPYAYLYEKTRGIEGGV